MFKSFFYRILQRRHFWRYATFGEIADLYTSRTLHITAMHLGSGFASVFLYKEGYSLVFIMSFWAVYFLFRTLIAPLAGLFAARFGIAQGSLISNIIYIPAMITLGLVPEFGLPMLIIFAICMGLSITLNEVCYSIQFSKVKSVLHAGKEIGFMNILEKIAISASPVIGGFIALVFGAQVTMWVAGFLFAIAALPLMMTTNQVEKHQQIITQGFPWRMAIPSIIARGAVGFDIVATSIIWGLFVAIVLLPSAGNDIYAILGILSSIAIVVAIIASISYGRIIDNKKGGSLLKIGVSANALVHISRAFVTTPAGAVGVNVVNEAATTAQNMAFLRGMFDTADLSGHRIMYLIGIEIANNIGAMIACIIMVVCASIVGGADGFRLFFVIAAFAILFVGSARFRLYRK